MKICKSIKSVKSIKSMKTKIFVVLFVIALVPAFTIIANQPGTEGDPLISRSYLEQRLAAHGQQAAGISDEMLNFLIQDISRTVLENLGQTGGMAGSWQAPAPAPPPAPAPIPEPSVERYTPVYVPGGHMLIGGEGTEIILRGGSAISFTEVYDGIINVTAGTELFNGDFVPINNVLIVPRNDGRGVIVTSAGAWFIIRGSYEIR
ncbi:MAG: hypothetical protein FWG63_12430 [Defluviitaleaceae bacterium]|nr:hypothetical protein [Defluviitaleaceae bacterium]